MNADMSNAEEAARTLKSGLDSRFTRARIVAIDPRSEADWQSLGTVITGPEDLLDAWREGGAFLIPLDPSIDALLITLAETGLIEVVDTTGRLSARSQTVSRVTDEEARRILGAPMSADAVDSEAPEPAPGQGSEDE